MKKPVYCVIASKLAAMANCESKGNMEWYERHQSAIEYIIKNHLPHGSGIDAGVKIDFDRSTEERIVLSFGFHHMDDNGFYNGWTEHDAIIKPSLAYGFTLRITGKDRRGIKEYLHETFHYVLSREIEEFPDIY